MAPGLPPPLALAYHGVAEVPLRQDPHGLFVRPEDLRRQIAKLRQWGYRLVSFGELAERATRSDAEGLASLTFDDGFSDNLETLVPLLREVSAPATVFVVSEWLGQPHPVAPWARILNEDELRALRTAGVEVGAHSATHPDLSALSYEDARQELVESRTALGAVLEEEIAVAAYPYGRASAETIRACRDAGFLAACTTTARGSWAEPHNLPRQDMENGSTLLGLRLKRDGRYEQLMRFAPARAARRLGRHAKALR